MKHKHSNSSHSSALLPIIITLVVFTAIVACVAIAFQKNKSEIQEELENGINAIAVSTQVNETETIEPEAGAPQESSSVVNSSSPSPEVSPTSDENLSAANNVYKEYLLKLLNDNLMPDGTTVELFGNSISDNQFAIYDIDGDGDRELILQITSTYSAAMIESVYSYDPENNDLSAIPELSVYPSVTYYDNGYVLVGWSHGNGKEPEGFWPFEIYEYNADTDCFDNTGEVYSDNIYGDCFLFRMGENWTSGNTDYYNSWMKDLLKSGKTLEIPYNSITAENINMITR